MYKSCIMSHKLM